MRKYTDLLKLFLPVETVATFEPVLAVLAALYLIPSCGGFGVCPGIPRQGTGTLDGALFHPTVRISSQSAPQGRLFFRAIFVSGKALQVYIWLYLMFLNDIIGYCQ